MTLATTSTNQAPAADSNPEILRFFSPRWFIAIMGTGAIANALQILSAGRSPVWHQAAVALIVLAVASYPVVLGLLLSRLWVDRDMVSRELRHSSLVQFYSAVFIAAAICATGLLKIPLPFLGDGLPLVLAKGFWWFAAVVGVTLAVFTPWRIITLNHGEPRRILGFWFLPPVGLFVLVFAGNFLAMHPAHADWVQPMTVFNAVLLGAAALQTIALFTMFLFRALAYPFPPKDVVPSFTIGLAPIGVAVIALLTYQPLLQRAALPGFDVAASLMPLIVFACVLLWGFGLWWLLVTIGIVATAAARTGVPFTLGFWAFIFPPAAFAIASLLLGQATQFALIQTTGLVLTLALAAAWLAMSILTVRGIISRRIFDLPPSFQEILAGEGAPKAGLDVVKVQERFPVFRLHVPKREQLSTTAEVVGHLKKKIEAHPVAKHIADFDHYQHTKAVGGDMPAGLVNAVNLLFCFGPKIDDPAVMGVRPRSFGIAEFKEHFTVTFTEAPAQPATDAMKDWAQSLVSS